MRALLAILLATNISAAVISGVVVDEAGNPIESARIGHIGKLIFIGPPTTQSSNDELRTNAEGAFEATTATPAFVVRKPGHESQRIRTADASQLRVTLHHIKPAPACTVRMPPVKHKKFNDSDYAGTWTSVQTKRGRRGILSGEGATYTFGAPNDNDVYYSVEYYEVMYDDGVVDARGRHPDGTYWRSQSFFRAAKRYDNVDRTTADVLDCIMDRDRLHPPKMGP